jgi:hypothetical protein
MEERNEFLLAKEIAENGKNRHWYMLQPIVTISNWMIPLKNATKNGLK